MYMYTYIYIYKHIYILYGSRLIFVTTTLLSIDVNIIITARLGRSLELADVLITDPPYCLLHRRRTGEINVYLYKHIQYIYSNVYLHIHIYVCLYLYMYIYIWMS
jgi:hypothetical protein